MGTYKFSPNSEYLAVAATDGRLRIWGVETGTVKQEFIPSSHLTASFCCLEWSPFQNYGRSKKNKRVKKNIVENTVAMGTAVGSLVFYSVNKSEMVSDTEIEHSGKVTGLTWSENSILYSCGEDGKLVEWDASNCKVLSRWTGSKSALSAVHAFGKEIISAGQSITLWDIKTKTITHNLSGHTSLVSALTVFGSVDYFLSFCYSERHLKIWSRKQRNAVATLSIKENPKFCHTYKSDDEAIVCVISADGTAFIYQHKLNGLIKKPVKPFRNVIIKDTLSKEKLLIFACNFTDSKDLILCYGSATSYRFERMQWAQVFENDDSEIVLERDFEPTTTDQHRKKKDSQLMNVPADVKHLQPGGDTELLIDFTNKSNKKRKNSPDETVSPQELPMEERLSNLTIGKVENASRPDGQNLSQLLSQGLHGHDVRILQSVLSRWDQDLINKTVRSLPVQLIVPLLTEIKRMSAAKTNFHFSLLKWLKAILSIHTSYLISLPKSEELLQPLLSLVKTRETLYPVMCQLEGKLKLIKDSILSKQFCKEASNEALLVYQDLGSDEDEDDEMMPSESDFLDSELEDVLNDSKMEINGEVESESGEGYESTGSDTESDVTNEDDDTIENNDEKNIVEIDLEDME